MVNYKHLCRVTLLFLVFGILISCHSAVQIIPSEGLIYDVPYESDLQGSIILNWGIPNNPEEAGIYVVQLPSRKLIHLTNKVGVRSYPALSPDKQLLAFRCVDSDIVGICTMDKSGRVERLVTEVEAGVKIPHNDIPVVWWHQGQALIFVGVTSKPQTAALYLLDIQNRKFTLLREFSFDGNGTGFYLRMSPDETTLLLWNSGIVAMDMESLEMNLLVDGGGGFWSPDGSQIAFFDRNPANGHLTINTISSDGSNRAVVYEAEDYQPDTPFCIQSSALAWSPDGRYLMVSEACGERDRLGDLYTLEIATQEMQLVLRTEKGLPEGMIWVDEW